MEKAYFHLLKQWCDELLALQLHGVGSADVDGAIICPACHIIHGRSHDAIYPLMYLAHKTGEEKYLNAARGLCEWSESLIADDGSFYNDAQCAWNGITVFAANNLCHALMYHGALLPNAEKARWEARLKRMGEWIYATVVPAFGAVINYNANCAGVMAILGKYFDCEKYRVRAREMAYYCLGYITESGLIEGEGKPQGTRTAKNCGAIDIGYNVEESLPGLLRYATYQNDAEAKAKVVAAMHAHLDFMLPDGGWDNSFGSRNFKWTYWGSRTSDGCQSGYAMLAGEIPEFGEAAYRNLELYARCSHGGLLYGGPHYRSHGEKACTHHAFCHAGALAAALDHGLGARPGAELPSDNPPAVKYYPEMDSYRVAAGDFRASVTGYDFNYMRGGHVSGGVMSLLWHRAVGPVLATGMSDYSTQEDHNMQLSLKKSAHTCIAARMDMTIGGAHYSQMYDYGCDIAAAETSGGVQVEVCAALADIDHNVPTPRSGLNLLYSLRPEDVSIEGRVSPAARADAEFVLPVILADDESWEQPSAGEFILHREGGDVKVTVSSLKRAPRRIFNLSGGFCALEIRIAPNAQGNFSAVISI